MVSKIKDASLRAVDKPKSRASYVPNKPNLALNVADIPGTSPRDLKHIGGLKRYDFFPNEPVTNNYYNREANGGNCSTKGHFGYNKHSPWSERELQEHEKRRVRRMYPVINAPHDASMVTLPPSRNRLQRDQHYTVENELADYDSRSNFDKLHNKRNQW